MSGKEMSEEEYNQRMQAAYKMLGSASMKSLPELLKMALDFHVQITKTVKTNLETTMLINLIQFIDSNIGVQTQLNLEMAHLKNAIEMAGILTSAGEGENARPRS